MDKAYKLLLDQEQKKRALDVIQAGKEYVEHTVKERKKQLKKEGKPTNVEEDDPELFKQAVYKQTMKLFAELEIKRKEREAKEMHERKRQREEEMSYMSCLYILEINPLSVVSFAVIFSHSEDCLFILLIVSFAVQKMLSLIRSHRFALIFVSITLGNGT